MTSVSKGQWLGLVPKLETLFIFSPPFPYTDNYFHDTLFFLLSNVTWSIYSLHSCLSSDLSISPMDTAFKLELGFSYQVPSPVSPKLWSLCHQMHSKVVSSSYFKSSESPTVYRVKFTHLSWANNVFSCLVITTFLTWFSPLLDPLLWNRS